MSSTLPVNWQDELAKQARDVAALERPSVSNINIRGGVMLYQNQPVPGNRMQVIILQHSFLRRYYSKKFNPQEIQSPDCFSISLTGEDMRPHENITNPINPTCDDCPFNQWGSDKEGQSGKGKKCKESRRFAMIPASSLEAGNVRKAEMAVLSIPATSIKNWSNYVNAVAAEFQRPPFAVITEVSLVPNPRTQFEIKFDYRGSVKEEHLGDVYARVDNAIRVLEQPYEEPGSEKQETPPASDGKKKKY
jgi:hypothetical protein